ncbi:MAG: transketolase [Candidatus Woesearchaeota archaeon]|jgi:transketolase|nr:transketolase [Candidatus Woesearchaeota archaeon]
MTNQKNLRDIANLLRRDVLMMTTKAGSGHPTTCMSCAEIISTLFFNEMSYDTTNPLNPDNDEFVLSKGHAAPILYAALSKAGCTKTDILSLRKFKSPFEGHPMPSSLKWVKAATGSLGQGAGVGVGMAIAAKLQKRKFRTYVLLGDSESAEGSVYESLELASHYKLDNLCFIIDINRLGQRGPTMLGHNIEAYQQRFPSFGAKVIAIDGHNVNEILNALKTAKKTKNKTTIILAKTFKGRGVSFLENKEGWHGKALNEDQLKKALKQIPDKKQPKITINKPTKSNFKEKVSNSPIKVSYKEPIATREAYGNALAKLAKQNNLIAATDAEVSNSTFSEKLKKSNPKRFIEAYIAEQNMASMALGLAAEGMDVFASTFAAFLSRAHDQIRMSALSSANITFVGSHVGVSIGEDGPSQMGLEDISIFRALPNSIVLYPSDGVSAEKLTELASKLKGIKYIRTSRPKTPIIYKNTEKFPLGEFKVLKKSNKDKAVIIGAGVTLHEALKAHKILKKKGINTAVIDCYCIKPLNTKHLQNTINQSGKKAVIVEDHYPEGGMGEAIISKLSNIKTKHLAVRKMPHTGPPDILLKDQKIDSSSIIKNVLNIIK